MKSLAPAMIEALPPVVHSIETLTRVLAFALLVFVVFACHRWLPGRKRPLRQLWPGIAVTLVLWAVSTLVFSAYLISMANYAATYAGLAGVMSAQIFLYLVAVVMIFGAELNAAIWNEKP